MHPATNTRSAHDYQPSHHSLLTHASTRSTRSHIGIESLAAVQQQHAESGESSEFTGRLTAKRSVNKWLVRFSIIVADLRWAQQRAGEVTAARESQDAFIRRRPKVSHTLSHLNAKTHKQQIFYDLLVGEGEADERWVELVVKAVRRFAGDRRQTRWRAAAAARCARLWWCARRANRWWCWKRPT